jgi:glycosyltransferase involved in cell wall biosynthesis/predicted Zn-dependent protease
MSRYLLGPVTAAFADQNLYRQRENAECIAFNETGSAGLALGAHDSWDALHQRLPGWEPDFLILYLAYTTIPDWLWSAPVPIVGLAMDWNLLWSGYRRVLKRCDLILTDSLGTDKLRSERFSHVQKANLFGCSRPFAEWAEPERARDIDVLMVTNLSPAVQRERLPWLGRLARLSDRWRVEIHSGVYGDAYRELLGRSRIVFNRSIRGECNLRTFEAISGGALLFQEDENREIRDYLEPGKECVLYNEGNFEALLDYFLEHEAERRAIAEAARTRIRQFSFENLWSGIVTRIEEQRDHLQARARERSQNSELAKCGSVANASRVDDLVGRSWQALASSNGHDPLLARDIAGALVDQPQSAALHNALGLISSLAEQRNGRLSRSGVQGAAGHFERALKCEPDHLLAGLNLVEALAALEENAKATDEARRLLARIDRSPSVPRSWVSDPHFPPAFDVFRVEWERAGWQNAPNSAAEASAKLQLLRWRLHTLLADLTGELAHFYEAASLRPDLPVTQAALGCALARAGRMGDAVPHLRQALKENPFDMQAAKALFQVLGDTGDQTGQRRLAAERRLLARATSTVPAEPWMMNVPPVGDELVSIIILCCNELEYTRLCLESVLRYTRKPYELIVVDNASTDGTPAYLEELRNRPEPERVLVIRNESNRGFAGGCNQAIAQARGHYSVFLNNDTVVTSEWLTRLVAWSLHDWPQVGLVGATSNYAPPPQRVVGEYPSLDALEPFAAKQRVLNAGKAIQVTRLTGFCLLVRREVLQQIGGFDERYGAGFFEDDDFCLRAAQAGYHLLVATDVFIHHFGSRTFNGLKLDGRQQLKNNLEEFRKKWGDEHASHYQLPPQPDRVVDSPEQREAIASSAAGSLGEPALCNGRMRVSLCMIVKNEEDNLRPCLQSVADLVDEMIVVDTGSTDGTKEIAADLGARVFDFPWQDSFSAARNESLRHATGDWIFWLDADDRVDEENRGKLKQLFANLTKGNAAYSMKCLCLPEGPASAATVVDHVRLFRNDPRIRWQYRVHEQILPAIRQSGGDARQVDVTIQHTGYQDPVWRGTKDNRNLRLLEMDHADDPENPFTLFNLGWTYEEMKRPLDALPLLQRSLELSSPGDSIVRKLFSLIMECHRQLGQKEDALRACIQGRQFYPEDAQLLFQEAILRREHGDLGGAESCLLHLLQSSERPHFASVVEGLRGHKARHNLAVIYLDQMRYAEAEAQWQAAIREEPTFAPAWIGLGELFLTQGRLHELDPVIRHLTSNGTADLPGTIALVARSHLARRQFQEARRVLEPAIEKNPRDVAFRVLLSHAHLQEGSDPDASERALRQILELAPDHPEARSNLAVLLRQRGQAPQEPTLAELYHLACSTPSDINEHCPALYQLAKQCRHVTEMGTRTGVSTAALLYAQPAKLVCYDVRRFPQVELLQKLAGVTEFVFHEADVMRVQIEPTDLLLIDTWHVYEQLREELRLHSEKARRFIVLHDTTTFAEQGESPGHRGLWPAVEEFLAQGTFRLKQRYVNNNGLTVLERM